METEEGFAVVDQHALHERLIYEKLRAKLEDGSLVSQRLLIPETIEVTPAQEELIEENSNLFTQLGIELEDFGPSTKAIQSFPTMLKKANPLEFVSDLLDKLSDKPWLRKVVQRLPAAVRPQAVPASHVIAFNGDGEILMNMHDPRARFPTLTGVLETPDALYLTTLFGNELPILAKRDLPR